MFDTIKNFFASRHLQRQQQRLSQPDYGYLFQPVAVDEWVSLDFEMTGLNPKKDYILSVGAVVIRREGKNFIIDTDTALSLVCRPPVMPSDDTIVVHGLRPIDVENGISYQAMLTQLLPILQNRSVVGFCVAMDMAFLNAIAKPFLGVSLVNPLVDVSQLHQQNSQRYNQRYHLHPDAPLKHLNDLLTQYQIPRLPAHNALNDAIMTAMLFTHLCNIQSKIQTL